MNAENKPKRLGEILIDEGVITKDQLDIALTEQKKVHEPLGKLLVNLGFATEAIMRSALGEALEQESVDLSRVVPDPDAIKMINSDTARKHKIIPLNYDPIRSTLTIAMSDTFNLFTLDRIRIQIGQHIELIPVLAGEAEISNAIDQFYGYELSIDGILREIETGEADYTNYQGDIEDWCAWSTSCCPTRSSAAPRICTSSRKKASSAFATVSMACCARYEACTRLTGRRSRCA
jgi:hypothetical protein